MAMLSRAGIITGPAKITYGSNKSVWTKGNILVTPSLETFDVDVSAIGNVTKRVKQRTVKLTFTPDGEWNPDVQTLLYTSYANLSIGASIGLGVAGADYPLEITPRNGKKVTLYAAFLTKIPSLKFSSVETRIGQAEFTILGVNTQDWSVADSLMTVAGSNTTITDFSSFVESDIKTEGTLATWNPTSAPSSFASFDTMDGFNVDFDMKFKAREIDTEGIIDFSFLRMDISIKATPVGPTENELTSFMTLQGTGSARGGDLASAAKTGDFVIKNLATTSVFSGRQMSLITVPMIYGEDYRVGQCEWVSTRKIDTGSLKSVYALGDLS